MSSPESAAKARAKREARMREAEEMHSESARLKAADLAPQAIATLEKLMAGKALRRGGDAPSPSVSLNAAKEILAQALGRPETRDPRVGDTGDRISITVLNLSSGERTPVDVIPTEVEALAIPADTRTKAERALAAADALHRERQGE